MQGYTTPITSLKKEDYVDLLKLAIIEDEVYNDITSQSIFNQEHKSKATIISREKAILCGITMAKDIFLEIDNTLQITLYKQDGDTIEPNEPIVDIKGKTGSILASERIALNFVSFLSGISTITHQIVKKLEPYNIKLLDTRKTLPGYRKLSKYAVYIGGGNNHRISLGDMGLIKDNHIAASGSIQNAIQKFKNKYPNVKYQIEIDTFKQLTEAIELQPQYILLDNMNTEQLTKCASYIQQYNKINNCNIFIEASGGFTADNIDILHNTGVQFVSMSKITMDSKNIDLSLEITSQ